MLYFDRATGLLQAWDDITVAGLGGTAAHIERHLASDTAPIGGPLPVISPPETPPPADSPATTSSPPGQPDAGGQPDARGQFAGDQSPDRHQDGGEISRPVPCRLTGMLLVDRDDLHAEAQQRDGNELEVGQAEADSDDRDAHDDAGDQVADRQLPAEQHDPDDVADQRAQAGVPPRLDRPPEGP